MSDGVDDKGLIRAALARWMGADADTPVVTTAFANAWQTIVCHLEPLIGLGGVQALYSRCLHMQDITDLGAAPPGADGPTGLAVRRHLEVRAPAAALDAAVDFFDCFSALLSSLIGARMTARLLDPVWAEGRVDKPAQETEP